MGREAGRADQTLQFDLCLELVGHGIRGRVARAFAMINVLGEALKIAVVLIPGLITGRWVSNATARRKLGGFATVSIEIARAGQRFWPHKLLN